MNREPSSTGTTRSNPFFTGSAGGGGVRSGNDVDASGPSGIDVKEYVGGQLDGNGNINEHDGDGSSVNNGGYSKEQIWEKTKVRASGDSSPT